MAVAIAASAAAAAAVDAALSYVCVCRLEVREDNGEEEALETAVLILVVKLQSVDVQGAYEHQLFGKIIELCSFQPLYNALQQYSGSRRRYWKPNSFPQPFNTHVQVVNQKGFARLYDKLPRKQRMPFEQEASN